MILSPRFRSRLGFLLLILIPSSAILNACSAIQLPPKEHQPSFSTSQSGTITLTPFQPVLDLHTPIPTIEMLPTFTPTISPTQSPAPIIEISSNSIWTAPFLPTDLSSQLTLPADFHQVESPEVSQVRLTVGDQQPISQWIYALVTPFPTITDQVSIGDIKQSWKGNPTGPFAGQPLLMNDSTHGVFSAWWGDPDLPR